MFRRYNIKMFCLIFFISIIYCEEPEDSLDVIKKFKPEDKYFKASIISLHFIIETSPISKVDTLFKQMISEYTLPISAVGCKDGEYIGESPYDAYDYKHIAKIKIKGEEIIFVDYNENNRDGRGKQEDEEYCKEMSTTGTTPAAAYPILEKQLVEKQDILKIDAVTGATYSLYRFRYAVIVALLKARLNS